MQGARNTGGRDNREKHAEFSVAPDWGKARRMPGTVRPTSSAHENTELHMFDLEQFVCDCRAALREMPSQNAIREVVARVVADPAAVLKRLGEPKRGEMQTLYRADDLTILNLICAPWMTVLRHNHRMWAARTTFSGAAWKTNTAQKLKRRGRGRLAKRKRCSWGRTSFIR
jgi:hypothetical protein